MIVIYSVIVDYTTEYITGRGTGYGENKTCNQNLSCQVVTQCYAERISALAEESFSNQPGGFQAVQRQLIGYFTDGLCYDYLQVKIMRKNTTTLQAAITLAVTEQL